MSGLARAISFIKSEWRFLFLASCSRFLITGTDVFHLAISGIIREDLNLSHGDFGTIYAIGTLASAAT